MSTRYATSTDTVNDENSTANFLTHHIVAWVTSKHQNYARIDPCKVMVWFENMPRWNDESKRLQVVIACCPSATPRPPDGASVGVRAGSTVRRSIPCGTTSLVATAR